MKKFELAYRGWVGISGTDSNDGFLDVGVFSHSHIVIILSESWAVRITDNCDNYRGTGDLRWLCVIGGFNR